ncbi:MAG: HD domain-containing protein [Nanoarchaeota archaeon]
MAKISYSSLERYTLGLLKKELSPNLLFHGVDHTIDVLNSAIKLGEIAKISKEYMLLLKTGAVLHDTGYLTRYENNEEIGVEMALKILPHFNYDSEQIDIINNFILATKIPQRPKTSLQEMLCDADLANLGRDDFFIKTELLRRELALMTSKEISPLKWYKSTAGFLSSHFYHTQEAKNLWQLKKEKNLYEINELLGRMPPP